MIYQALQAPNRGRWYKVSPAPENVLLTVHKTRYDQIPSISTSRKRRSASPGSRILLFEAPTFKPLSNEAKVLYAFILRRTELSRKNGWADDCGRIFLYYPICEVVDLLHCGRQKAVNTLRELQYAGLVEIQKQGCGKPNRIFPKSYEAVPNTDFKKSGSGTPED